MLSKILKFIVFVFFLNFTVNSFAVTYYLSSTGSGTGTLASPMSFTTAIAKTLTAGDSLLLRGGMYSFNSLQQISKSGSSAKFLFIGAYKGEIPILDFRAEPYNSSNQGVKISGSYVHFKGVIIQGAGDNGLQVTGSNNKIELCVTRWNCDAGTQMKTGSDNLILNCDSYENFDYETGGISSPDYGGNADGFADKQYKNAGTNTYKGCRSWRNGDDGWDSYQKYGNTVYDSCWCYSMSPATFDMSQHIRFKTDSASWFYQFKSTNYVIKNYGNGNGFKLGGDTAKSIAILHHCVSVGNPVKGFDQNNNSGTMTLYNCTSYNNGYNYGFSNSSYGTLIIKNCASLTSINSNTLKCHSVTQTNNTWNTGFSCVVSDFVSTDYTQILNPRQSDGSLPEITLLHLKSTSTMIDKGINVGYSFFGSTPDLGAFEYSASTAIETIRENLQFSSIYFKSAEILTLKGSITYVEVFDIAGRKIFNEKVDLEGIILSTSRWNKGIYIIKGTSKEGEVGISKVLIN